MRRASWFRNPSTALIVVHLLIRLTAVLTIPRNRRPTAAMAWLLAVFAAPIPGSILFGLFGTTKLPLQRRQRQRQMTSLIADAATRRTGSRDAVGPPWFSSLTRLNERLGGMPLVRGSRASILPLYDDALASMTAAVDRSTTFVNVQFYICSLDAATTPFFDALLRAQQRGVDVRVLYDHFATTRSPRYRVTRRWLREHAIPFHEMLAPDLEPGKRARPDLRNHRKILIVDGTVAFMGSQNLVDATYNTKRNLRLGLRWRDLLLRLEGPVVTELLAVFVTDWFSETDEILSFPNAPALAVPATTAATAAISIDCQVVPSGPGFDGENNLRLFNALVYAAEERLVITSPYFVPDDSMLYAITTAAQRGVEVVLFASEVADQVMVFHAQRSYYETLLRAGVRIFLYRKPIVLHAKHFTIDEDTAVVGSSNMDMRSFSLNLEASLLIRSRTFVAALGTVEQHYRDNARELTLDEWLRRPVASRTFDNLFRLTAALQ
ncbi:phospholipase D-like domain-containing protein [Curtobacterium sp. ISL-83]|uniref:phospholipase D-like domain-containing protein n=1 Tax=Curtobacterium sp. ISL-83 TaxID=2819145 RepID=UPI001BE7671B|nr:phospholipase D-like domain-containing protein [Curtobacterium sp. ISL-83]MBT2501026.1 cardiolipin synthase A [Curtobacterium sp. ISL-83]